MVGKTFNSKPSLDQNTSDLFDDPLKSEHGSHASPMEHCNCMCLHALLCVCMYEYMHVSMYVCMIKQKSKW